MAAADLVVHNAVIESLDARRSVFTALAVKDGSIVYTGNDDKEALSFAGPQTKVVDAGGRLVLPGFIETHIHALAGALIASGLILNQDDSADAIAGKVADYIRAHPDKRAVHGQGYSTAIFPAAGPRKEVLDAVAPDIPVVLLSWDLHAAWANSAALKAANLTSASPDLGNAGKYDRDPKDNSPTGSIRSSPAYLPVLVAAGLVTPEAVSKGLSPILNGLAAQGFTTVFDAGAPLVFEAGLEALAQMDADDSLPTRFSASYIVNNAAMLDSVDVVQALKDADAKFSKGRVLARTLKCIGDGVVENRRAAFLADYSDEPGFKGNLVFDQLVLNKLVTDVSLAGFDVMIHGIGDAAARAILDAFESARKAGAETRLCHTHAELVDREDRKRYKELDVIVETTGVWINPNPVTLPILGADRYNRRYMFKELLEQGVVVSLGSDWPATSGGWLGTNPFGNMEGAVTRKIPAYLKKALVENGTPEELEKALEPVDECWTIRQAVEAYTINAAKQLRMEHLVGSLEVGKKADFILLDRNVFEVEKEEIHTVKVLATVMDGKLTHDMLHAGHHQDGMVVKVDELVERVRTGACCG